MLEKETEIIQEMIEKQLEKDTLEILESFHTVFDYFYGLFVDVRLEFLEQPGIGEEIERNTSESQKGEITGFKSLFEKLQNATPKKSIIFDILVTEHLSNLIVQNYDIMTVTLQNMHDYYKNWKNVTKVA
eukprot:CAMPEP_0197014484 /NCGR_PEP_ID=MMETSP1380-20130617/70526_1 /TAXON_ID=5936 /ORGANISM="Euplotes crassus, Strain CT5" /LENGTH=129 /DNA_ID=CAMNT_0042439591 /DNA_START=191 /DNA_END=577 /DNA_ORIENTATION=-